MVLIQSVLVQYERSVRQLCIRKQSFLMEKNI